MVAARVSIAKLRKRDGSGCHHCGKTVTKETATRDHVFPRSLGGRNTLDNFVLACDTCNHKRGNALFFCDCRDCLEIIFDGLYNPELVGKAFETIIRVNKPKIRKKSIHCRKKFTWQVDCGPVSKSFESFEDAVDYLSNNNYSVIEEPN